MKLLFILLLTGCATRYYILPPVHGRLLIYDIQFDGRKKIVTLRDSVGNYHTTVCECTLPDSVRIGNYVNL